MLTHANRPNSVTNMSSALSKLTHLQPCCGIPGVLDVQQDRSYLARNVFIEAGMIALNSRRFDDLHVADIAQAAGQSVGGFYSRFEDKEAFFKEDGGFLMISSAHCTTNIFELGPIELPAFAEDFVESLKMLERAKDLNSTLQDQVFSLFVEDYGTHYISKGAFGAKVLNSEFIIM